MKHRWETEEAENDNADGKVNPASPPARSLLPSSLLLEPRLGLHGAISEWKPSGPYFHPRAKATLHPRGAHRASAVQKPL